MKSSNQRCFAVVFFLLCFSLNLYAGHTKKNLSRKSDEVDATSPPKGFPTPGEIVEAEGGQLVIVQSYIGPVFNPSAGEYHYYYKGLDEKNEGILIKIRASDVGKVRMYSLNGELKKSVQDPKSPTKPEPEPEKKTKKDLPEPQPRDGDSRERIRVDRKTIPRGTIVTTPTGKKYTITKYVDEGRRGIVYQVKDNDGKLFALKIAKNDLRDTLESIKDEVAKADGVKRLNLRQAKIYESGKRFVVKEWVEGKRGEQWFQEWVSKGEDKHDPIFIALMDIFDRASAQGGYVGDLNPKNLVWDGKEWVILESGSSRFDLSPKEALKRFKEKFAERWGKRQECKKLYKILGVERPTGNLKWRPMDD